MQAASDMTTEEIAAAKQIAAWKLKSALTAAA
jgi:hypothetical protein